MSKRASVLWSKYSVPSFSLFQHDEHQVDSGYTIVISRFGIRYRVTDVGEFDAKVEDQVLEVSVQHSHKYTQCWATINNC